MDTLKAIGETTDADIDLFDAALKLAGALEPGLGGGLDLEPYHRHGRRLAEDVRAYVNHDEARVELVGEALAQVLNRRYGYHGTTDPLERGDGANLARTIDRRRGSALALCILYARALVGLDVRWSILDFPPRALLRIEDAFGQRAVIDPFATGEVLSAPMLRDLYFAYMNGANALDPFAIEAFAPRDVLVALLDDMKAFALRQSAPEAALGVIDAGLAIAPNHPRLWREAGLLHARLDHIPDAISALKRFLDLPGGDVHRYTASQMLQQLQTRLDRNR